MDIISTMSEHVIVAKYFFLLRFLICIMKEYKHEELQTDILNTFKQLEDWEDV